MPAISRDSKGSPNARGRPPKPNPRTIPTVVHLSRVECDCVNAAAEREDRPRSWWIRKAILEKLERDTAGKAGE